MMDMSAAEAEAENRAAKRKKKENKKEAMMGDWETAMEDEDWWLLREMWWGWVGIYREEGRGKNRK